MREFSRQVAETGAPGWAVDAGQFTAGAASIAVPVFDNTPRLAMACTGTMFTSRYDRPQAERIAADLTSIGTSITQLSHSL